MIGKQFIDLFFRVETKDAQKDIDNVGDIYVLAETDAEDIYYTYYT